MKRVLWFAIGLFMLGEVVGFLWWLLPDDLRVVPVLLAGFGVLFLGASFLAPERVLVAGGCPPPPPTALDELAIASRDNERAFLAFLERSFEDAAARRTALYDEDDE